MAAEVRVNNSRELSRYSGSFRIPEASYPCAQILRLIFLNPSLHSKAVGCPCAGRGLHSLLSSRLAGDGRGRPEENYVSIAREGRKT